MRKVASTILILAICTMIGFSFFTVPVLAQEGTNSNTKLDYEPLSGEIPGLDSKNVTFAGFLDSLFGLALGGATILAVLMIVIGGFTYMTSDSFSQKKSGLEMLNNAVIGLLIALGAWLILYEINPKLLEFNLELPPVNNASTETSGGGIPQGSCSNCTAIPSNVLVKPNACNSTTGCKVAPTLAASLSGLAEGLDGISWRVTEAWPPTTNHQNSCHLSGTCVDANFTGGTVASPDNIDKFAEEAIRNGLTACYEVGTSAQRDRLVGEGVNPSNIGVVSGINASHFSVYGGRKSCN